MAESNGVRFWVAMYSYVLGSEENYTFLVLVLFAVPSMMTVVDATIFFFSEAEVELL